MANKFFRLQNVSEHIVLRTKWRKRSKFSPVYIECNDLSIPVLFHHETVKHKTDVLVHNVHSFVHRPIRLRKIAIKRFPYNTRSMGAHIKFQISKQLIYNRVLLNFA